MHDKSSLAGGVNPTDDALEAAAKRPKVVDSFCSFSSSQLEAGDQIFFPLLFLVMLCCEVSSSVLQYAFTLLLVITRLNGVGFFVQRSNGCDSLENSPTQKKVKSASCALIWLEATMYRVSF